jgi:glycerophosphoryl diester phosphodiesterase
VGAPPDRANPFAHLGVPFGLAHRGGAGEATENSPTAFQNAADRGFRAIETDVRATIDGHAVVFHDASLDRTTDRSGVASALPLAHLRGAHLANGDHPITLVEALERWPDVVFNVDVKADDTVEPFLRAVGQVGAWDRVCAASFSTRRMARMRALAGPRLATSLGSAEVLRLATGTLPRTVACAAQVPQRAGRFPLVTPAFVRRAHALELQVHVWTVNDPVEMVRLLDLGVDAVITDRPTVLREVLTGRRPG